jgi:beta-lactamase class A
LIDWAVVDSEIQLSASKLHFMVARTPTRKIRHSLWRKLFRRRRRVHAAPAQVLQRRQQAQKMSRKQRRKPRKVRVSAKETVRSQNSRAKKVTLSQPVPLYVYVSRCSIVLFGAAAISGTVMSVIKPPATQISAASKVTPAPAKPVVKPENLALKQSLQTVIDRYPGFQPHVAVVDVNGGVVDVAGAAVVPAASTIKIPILIALFQRIDRGEIKLDEQLTLQKSMLAAGSGSLAKSPEGSKFSVQEVATKMITISDNTAANLLIDRLGGKDQLNLQFRSWGLQHTNLRSPLPDFEGTNMTSSQELVKLLGGLKSDKGILSASSKQAVLEILRQTKRNTMLPAGIDDDQAKIAHKTGEISTMVADAGLVELANGQSYLLVAMVQRPSDNQRAEVLIKQLSQTVFKDVAKK